MTSLLLLLLASEVATPALDMRVLVAIALIVGLLALTVVNVWLYNRVEAALKQRVLQMAALSEISKELFLTLNQDQVYKLLLDRAFESVRANSGVIILYERPDEPHIVARRNDAKTTTATLVALDSYRDTVQQAGAMLDTTGPFDNHMRSRILVPILREKEVLAVIVLESRYINAFSDEDFSFIRQLAAQAGIVIENARMFDWVEESRRRLQVILDSMTEGVIVLGTDGKVALANPTVGTLLNLNPQLLITETAERLLSRADLQFAAKIGFGTDELRRLLSAPELLTAHTHHLYELHNHGQVTYVDRTLAPIWSYAGRLEGVVMVFSDVTEEQQATQTREDLTRMIVHDLRSPLTALNASMKLLGELATKETTALTATLQRTTDTSQRALRKMLHMVNSLLDIAKMENGNLDLDREFYLLRPLAEAVKNEMTPLAEELEIKIEVDMPTGLPATKIEADKIERVLLNLVDNALKYSPLSSTITIRGRHANSAAGDTVRIEVIDNGPGVPDDQKQHIFERFHQVETGQRGRRTGTGLGLTFCRMAVRAHGGDIWIEDNPAGGSIFVFTLPAAVTVMQDEHAG
jgi:PAS domain S-box-containing protein